MTTLPPGLREALVRESAPVRPQLPAAARTAVLVAVACAAVLAHLTIEGLRSNAAELGSMPMWAPVALRVLAATALLVLAFRSAIPGMWSSRPLRTTALIGAPALLVLLAEYLERASGVATIVHGAYGCYPRELMVALPAGLVLAGLLARSYTLHPVFVAVTGTLGVGLLADTALHLTCPATNASHTVFVHGAAVATLAVAGAAVGYWSGRKSPRRL